MGIQGITGIKGNNLLMPLVTSMPQIPLISLMPLDAPDP